MPEEFPVDTHRFFRPASNLLIRLTLIGILLIVGAGGWASYEILGSPFFTRAGMSEDQPVPFSHKHHVGDDGIDCRYCHATVERSAYAGMPTSETCMKCHSEIWTTAPVLAPVRASFVSKTPIEWRRVHNLPEFVYFDHSIHVSKGVGCVTCHGRVDKMSMTYQYAPLTMEWCLECHRTPEKFIRPRDAVFQMDWTPSHDSPTGKELLSQYRVKDSRSLTDCTTCHR